MPSSTPNNNGDIRIIDYRQGRERPSFEAFEKKKVVEAIEMTLEKGRILDRALSKVYAELEKKNSQRGLPSERREAEYLSLMQAEQQASFTSVAAVVNSELPVHLDRIEWETLKNMATSYAHLVYSESSGQLSAICTTCNTKVPHVYAFFCLGSVYCVEHIPAAEECIACHKIQTGLKTIDTVDGTKVRACSRCVARLICPCEDRMVPTRLIEYRVCNTCWNKTESNKFPRPFSKNTTWISKEPGTKLDSPRIFSCELEAILPPDSNLIAKLMSSIPSEVGASGDGSITGVGIGVELQTPRLGGAKGEELVSRITAGLKTAGATVNDSCGFHIHLDGAGVVPQSRSEYPKALIQLWKAHLVFEDVILSFLPFQRRFNRYCRPMRDYFKLSELMLLTSMFEVEKLWYKQHSYESISADKGHHYHPSRYFGLNMHSLLGNKNLEIRFHTGTLNAKKILHWVNLHSLIMDNAIGISDGYLNEAQATSNLKEKTKMLFDIIGLNAKSQQYFYERQRLFSDKTVAEDEGCAASFSRIRRPSFIINGELN